MTLNDLETDVRTRKQQAVVRHVRRRLVKDRDTLCLTDGRKWNWKDFGYHSVGRPNFFKVGDIVQVEVEHKITKLHSEPPQVMFPYDSLWNLLGIVLLLSVVSWAAGFVCSAIFHISGPGGECIAEWFCISSGPPEISWVSLLVFLAVFLGLWHPLVRHLERRGSWGIWETASPPLEAPKT